MSGSLQTVKPQLKYGLINKSAAAPPKRLKPVFKVDSDEEGDSDNQVDSKHNILRVNKRLSEIGSKINPETTKMYEEALTTDASVFDYDGAYDSFKANEAKAASVASIASAATAAPVRLMI